MQQGYMCACVCALRLRATGDDARHSDSRLTRHRRSPLSSVCESTVSPVRLRGGRSVRGSASGVRRCAARCRLGTSRKDLFCLYSVITICTRYTTYITVCVSVGTRSKPTHHCVPLPACLHHLVLDSIRAEKHEGSALWQHVHGRRIVLWVDPQRTTPFSLPHVIQVEEHRPLASTAITRNTAATCRHIAMALVETTGRVVDVAKLRGPRIQY